MFHRRPNNKKSRRIDRIYALARSLGQTTAQDSTEEDVGSHDDDQDIGNAPEGCQVALDPPQGSPSPSRVDTAGGPALSDVETPALSDVETTSSIGSETPSIIFEGLNEYEDVADNITVSVAPPGDDGTDVEDEDDREPADSKIHAFELFMASLHARYGVSLATLARIKNHMQDNVELWLHVLSNLKLMRHPKTMMAHALKLVPAVRMTVVCTERVDDEEEEEDPKKAKKRKRKRPVKLGPEVVFTDVLKFPKKIVAERRLVKQYVHYYISLKDVIRYHRKRHATQVQTGILDFSVDGVPESKSGGVSIDVLSVRFPGCRHVYSIGVLQPAKKGMGLSDSILITKLLSSIRELNLTVRWVIADAPKRAKLLGMKQHNSTFSCQYCLCKKLDGNFPKSTMNSPERTWSSVMDTVRAIEQGRINIKRAPAEEYKSIVGRSLLCGLRSFAVLDQVPAERLHLVDLGITKRMIGMMYDFPLGKNDKRKPVTFRPAPREKLNSAMKNCKSVSDMSRRPRAVDPANWKAQEFKYLLLGFWPVVSGTCDKTCIRVWLLTVFLVRAVCLPDQDYYDITDRKSVV